MNKKAVVLAGLVACAIVAVIYAADNASLAALRHEYATIRWAGRENTHIIRPGGQVEMIGLELRKLPKPERTDERSFYMNAAMNGLAKEGFEFAGMTSDDIVMKRALP